MSKFSIESTRDGIRILEQKCQCVSAAIGTWRTSPDETEIQPSMRRRRHAPSDYAEGLRLQYAETGRLITDLCFLLNLEIPEIYALARKLGEALSLNERLRMLRGFYLEQGRLPQFTEETE